MSDLTPFDFDGLDESAIVVDANHGPCVMSERFIRWAGWSTPANVRRDHLRPGDEVEISTSTKRGRGKTQSKVKYLTKRGVQRLLFRSNHERAVAHTDRVLDILEELDRAGVVIDEKRITDRQIDAGQKRLDDLRIQRIQERQDYQQIRRALKLGGAVSEDYRYIQNTLYVGLFGQTAKQIRESREIRTWDGKRGPTKADRDVAKNYLTAAELKRLDSTVLIVFAQIEMHYPAGTRVSEMAAAISAAVKLALPRAA